VYHRATSMAARFLDTLLDRVPFPVKALQVDGGIYWTSTPICRNLTLRVQSKIASRPSDAAVAHPFRGEALPSHEELAVQTGRDRMEPHETRYSSRLSPRHGALRLRP
jgi:hypothetical protein